MAQLLQDEDCVQPELLLEDTEVLIDGEMNFLSVPEAEGEQQLEPGQGHCQHVR